MSALDIDTEHGSNTYASTGETQIALEVVVGCDGAHAAEELAHPDRRIVIVVGSADHAYHRIGGSVAGHLAHQNRFALLVAPSEPSPDERSGPVDQGAEQVPHTSRAASTQDAKEQS